MKCDLHIHSNYSTGTQSIEEIIRESLSKDISLISITDDDSMQSYGDVEKLSKELGISYIRGVQVSAIKDGHLFRLLAYGCEENDALSNLLQKNREIWDEYGEHFIKYLSKYYPELSVEGYRLHIINPSLGGFKYNNYMSSIGLDGSDSGLTAFFKEHMNEMKSLVNDMPFSTMQDVIKIIHDAKGKVIVPGGYIRNIDTFEEELNKIIALGADGLEIFSASYDENFSLVAKQYAHKHNLLITGGGDGHGDWANKDTYAIGIREVLFDELQLGDIKIYN